MYSEGSRFTDCSDFVLGSIGTVLLGMREIGIGMGSLFLALSIRAIFMGTTTLYQPRVCVFGREKGSLGYLPKRLFRC